jgi:hypothetical protein
VVRTEGARTLKAVGGTAGKCCASHTSSLNKMVVIPARVFRLPVPPASAADHCSRLRECGGCRRSSERAPT